LDLRFSVRFLIGSAGVQFCATFCSKPSISRKFVCLFFHDKFLTILASIVGYEKNAPYLEPERQGAGLGWQQTSENGD
jgi:hypothetical protein